MDWLNSNSVKLTQKTLDNLWQRQRYSLENIANVETPNYKSKYVKFEDQLRARISEFRNSGDASLIKSNVSEAIDSSDLYLHQSTAESTREDGNNVDVDSEYIELLRTQLQYQYAVRQINQEFSRLRLAIEG
ncbi:MAG: flagellar basal body rod protein FlgB [Firmicutes bacterium]|nr:flagellar basal body rod protein FlgB [Bacillota bacterium]